MVTTTASTTTINTVPLLSNALLLIGSHEKLQTQLIDRLQQFFCQPNCKTCITCTQIQNFQHHALVWCSPTGNAYNHADIDAIFEKTQFALDNDQHCFVIITHADRLPAACANRLLKTLEEPAPGYHFILLSRSQESILPTIQSRCIIQHTDHESSTPVLWDHFVTTADPVSFLQALQTTTIAEHEVVQ